MILQDGGHVNTYSVGVKQGFDQVLNPPPGNDYVDRQYDVSGRLVKSFDVSGGGYSVWDLARGIYAVRVLDVEGLVVGHGRFTKE